MLHTSCPGNSRASTPSRVCRLCTSDAALLCSKHARMPRTMLGTWRGHSPVLSCPSQPSLLPSGGFRGTRLLDLRWREAGGTRPDRAKGRAIQALTSVSHSSGDLMATSRKFLAARWSKASESLIASMAERTMSVFSPGVKYPCKAYGRKEGSKGLSHRVPPWCRLAGQQREALVVLLTAPTGKLAAVAAVPAQGRMRRAYRHGMLALQRIWCPGGLQLCCGTSASLLSHSGNPLTRDTPTYSFQGPFACTRPLLMSWSRVPSRGNSLP